MSAENIAAVRRWFDEVWNQRREGAMHELMGPEAVCFTDHGEMRGADGFKAMQYDPFVAAFPDLQVTVDGALSDGEMVAVRWTAEGTHTGAAMGLAPTGRKVRFTGSSWIKVRDGKLWEGWQWSDISTVMASLQS